MSPARGRSAGAFLDIAESRHAPRAMVEACEADSEGVLASIDRLYSEVLQGEASAAQGPVVAAVDDRLLPAATPAVLGTATRARSDAGAAHDAEGSMSAGEFADVSVPAARAEVREILEEVLWSALLLGRGTGGRIDVQSRLLELLPSDVLMRCAHASCNGLPPSLLQRLAAELPQAFTALAHSPQDKCSPRAAAALVDRLREARDGLLALASSSDVSADDMSGAASLAGCHAPPASASLSMLGAATAAHAASAATLLSSSADSQEPLPKKPKPRRSSMSYWTPASLDSLEPPKRWGSTKQPKG